MREHPPEQRGDGEWANRRIEKRATKVGTSFLVGGLHPSPLYARPPTANRPPHHDDTPGPLARLGQDTAFTTQFPLYPRRDHNFVFCSTLGTTKGDGEQGLVARYTQLSGGRRRQGRV